jgi:hypothetical protein
MTVDEIIKTQKETGDVLLVRRGKFYNGFNEGAFFLGHLRHYQVKEKRLEDGTTYYQAGFPPVVLDSLLKEVDKAGGKVVEHAADGSLIRLHGVETAYDEKLITVTDPSLLLQPRKIRSRVRSVKADIEEVILQYDLANKTPIDALNFINELRNLILDRRHKQIAVQEQRQQAYDQRLDNERAEQAADGLPTSASATDAVPFADAGAVGPAAQG